MISVYIGENLLGMDLNISIVQHFENNFPSQILRLGDGSLARTWETIDPLVHQDPTLRLSGDEARALLGALMTHFQGTDDQRLLRADYQHERERVDKLTDAVVELAKGAVLNRAGGDG